MTEGDGSTVIRNVGNYSPNDMTSYSEDLNLQQ